VGRSLFLQRCYKKGCDMDNNLEQNAERPESRQERENELRSIREIIERMAEAMLEAMKAPEEKYAEGLTALADLLTDLNTTAERLIKVAIEIRDRLQPPAK